MLLSLFYAIYIGNIVCGAESTGQDLEFERALQEGGALSNFLMNFNTNQEEMQEKGIKIEEKEVKPSFLDELTVEEFLELTNHQYDFTPATRKPYKSKTDKNIVEDMEKVDEGKNNDPEVDIVIQLLDDQVNLEVVHRNDIIKLNDQVYKKLDIQQKQVHPLDQEFVNNNPSIDPTPTLTKNYNSPKEDITGTEAEQTFRSAPEVETEMFSAIDMARTEDVNLPAYISNPSNEQKHEEEMSFDDVYQRDLSQSTPNEQNIRVNKAHLPVYSRPVGEEDVEQEEEETSDEGLMNFITRWFG